MGACDWQSTIQDVFLSIFSYEEANMQQHLQRLSACQVNTIQDMSQLYPGKQKLLKAGYPDWACQALQYAAWRGPGR